MTQGQCQGFLAEYAKLDKDVQGAVDQAIATFAMHAQPGELRVQAAVALREARAAIARIRKLAASMYAAPRAARPSR